MPTRICLFGDSHYACLREAQTEGLVDTTGLDVEHWGHVGRLFLNLKARDGVVYSEDEMTARRFAKFNEQGRTELVAAAFDMILVMGARVYVTKLFLKLLEVLRSERFSSQSLRLRIARDQLRQQFGYDLARKLAVCGTTRVLLAPTSFPTENPLDPTQAEALQFGADESAEVWHLATRAAHVDGIELLPQPEETRASGWYTKADFAVDDHVAKADFAHRNARYGALILGQALTALRQGKTA